MEAAGPSFLGSSSNLHSLPPYCQHQPIRLSSLRFLPYSWDLNRSLRADESDLVRCVLRMLQGFSSHLFQWEPESQSFSVKDGVYVPHLSQASLHALLDRFIFASDCLKIVEIFVKKVEASRFGSPTLRAFSASVSSWLQALRGTVLEEEAAVTNLGEGSGATTLLGVGENLSSVCSRAECLLQIVEGSVPSACFDSQSLIIAAELAVQILDNLFLKLNGVCLVQGGEEAYHMILTIFTGSLLPYLEEIDSWLYDGILDDPYDELFFYSNKLISVDQPEFWEKSYLLRPGGCRNSNHKIALAQRFHGSFIQDEKSEKPHSIYASLKEAEENDDDTLLCPLFLKGVAKAIISAGKSLQLVRHVWSNSSIFSEEDGRKLNFSRTSLHSHPANYLNRNFDASSGVEYTNNYASEVGELESDGSSDTSTSENREAKCCQRKRVLKLQEIFLISLVGLIGDGTHICEYIPHAFLSPLEIIELCKEFENRQEFDKERKSHNHKIFWLGLMVDAMVKQSRGDIDEVSISSTHGHKSCSIGVTKISLDSMKDCTRKILPGGSSENNKVVGFPLFYPQNPVITPCRDFLLENAAVWDELNISMNFHLPPLDDEVLRGTIFEENFSIVNKLSDQLAMNTLSSSEGTSFKLGYKSHQFGDLHSLKDEKTLETLYPFPTLLPCLQENLPVSKFISFQKNGAIATQVLNWLHREKPDVALLPSVIIQECLIVYICNQVDFVGDQILMKMTRDWKLMDELNVLRSIYLLGSGDLLHQFLMVIFDKVDKGDSLGDEFELNTVLQESIRNSIDGPIIGSPEFLTVSVTKHDISDVDGHAASDISTSHKGHKHAFGVDALDPVTFTYKVSWPLDLIINKDAIKKYNLVMNFLLKVKRAKFVLDKARRWMWKFGGSMTCTRKHHLLVEQKLLHFVDAFHQYVMDKVLHSSWLEICNGMASAGSLDDVIDMHEAYLLSIQRQCFVASDKLWILIASRVKIILGLALDFYATQQTLISGGAAFGIKARCEMEVDRIEREFDECIAFLLRVMSFKLNVGHFPHLADLVTRINYNYFYMSDDGSLLTIPSFELSGPKPQKAFHGKIES